MLWVNENIVTIKWGEFFQVVPNKYKVFKIIPHLNVTNNQNRHVWAAIHKAYELYHHMHKRAEFTLKTGLKIREKDYIWIDTVFKVRNGQKQIEFYISTTETMAKKFKNLLENHLAVTLEESSINTICIPEKDTVLHEMRLSKHDIFSLNTNHNEQTTPIKSILDAVNEMDEEGDFARVSLFVNREDKKKWLRRSLWALENTKKGKVPDKQNINPKKVIRGSKTILGGILNQVIGVINDTIQGISKVFFNDNEKMIKTKIEQDNRIDELKSLQVGDRTHKKVDSPVFKTHMRIAVHSKKKFNRDNVSNAIASAYTELSDKNELITKEIRFNGIDIKIGSKQFKVKSRKQEILEELNTL